MSTPADQITLTIQDKTAIITLDRPSKLNALTADHFYRLACLLREVAARPDIYITVLTGTGRYFSAGADVNARRPTPSSTTAPSETRHHYLHTFAAQNLDLTNAFHTHPKILITALNGPAIGLSAALIAHSDFIYAAPHAFLLTPFTSLGLVAEGGASRVFVEKLGWGKAGEALILGRRVGVGELLGGLVTKVLDGGEGFLERVLGEVREGFEGVNLESAVRVKALMKEGGSGGMDAVGAREVMGGLERFVEGVPQREFKRVAEGKRRHKL